MIPPGKNHSVRLCATFVRTVNVPGRYGDGYGGHGLSLLVAPRKSGGFSKTWAQAISPNGAKTSLGLGSYPVVTLAMARDRALANARAIAEGRDTRRRMRQVPTFEKANETVLAIHARHWPLTARRIGKSGIVRRDNASYGVGARYASLSQDLLQLQRRAGGSRDTSRAGTTPVRETVFGRTAGHQRGDDHMTRASCRDGSRPRIRGRRTPRAAERARIRRAAWAVPAASPCTRRPPSRAARRRPRGSAPGTDRTGRCTGTTASSRRHQQIS